MSRRRRTWMRRGHPVSDASLDALLAGTWQDGAAALAEVLDLEGGKAALGHLTQLAAGPDEPGEPDQDAVAAVCEEVARLLAVVTSETAADLGPAHTAATGYLLEVRRSLIQLRAGLIKRTLDRAPALQLARRAGHALAEAGQGLHRLPPDVAGDDAPQVHATLAGLQQRLAQLTVRVERLYDDTGTTTRVPASR